MIKYSITIPEKKGIYMKAIKRSAALLLSVLLCLSFAACGRTVDAGDIYKTYTEAEKKTNTLEKYCAEVVMDLDLDFGNNSDMHIISTTALTADLPGNSFLQDMSQEMVGYGDPIEMSLYHKDGVTYYTSSSEKYKYDQTDEDAMDSIASVAAFDLPEAAFEDARVKGAKDITVTSKVAGNDVASVLLDFLQAVDTISETENEYILSETDIELVIDSEGYLTLMSLDFSADFTSGDTPARADVTVTVKYTDVSGKVTVAAPEGIADYIYYDEYSSQQEELDGLAIEAAFELFEDDNQTKVENYDELYAEACEKYGKERMDSVIELIVMFGSLEPADSTAQP